VDLVTPRLRLRAWTDDDREPFAALNADARVMEFFPSVLSRHDSDALAERIAAHIDNHGWGLWAVEVPGATAFAGSSGSPSRVSRRRSRHASRSDGVSRTSTGDRDTRLKAPAPHWRSVLRP